MKGFPLIAACGLLVLVPTRSWAAAQAPCAPAAMVPAVASVPANLPAFGYTALKATQNDVHLFSTSGVKTELGVTVGPVADGYLKVAPVAPLVVGGSYEIVFDAFCTYGAYPAPGPLAFTVAPAAPLPTKLANATGTPTVVVKDYGTSRYDITATYVLEAEMKPWAAVYRLGLTFDGQPIQTKVTTSGDTLQIAATGWCDEASASRAKHDVALRARLPFATTLQTATSTLAFACPAPKIQTSPPVTPVFGTNNPDPNGNANGNSNGSPNANPGTSSGSSGGCSVGTNAGAPLSFAGIMLAIATLGGVRRRRVSRTLKGEV